MVYKIVSTWSAPKPGMEEEFEEYYEKVHAPFAARLPGLQHLMLTRTSDPFETTPSAFYRVAEVWFESREALEECVASKEWAEMRVDGGYVHDHFGCVLTSGQGVQTDFPLDPGGPKPVSGAESA
jgi:uncharacterized protein (TIGR02118 family)